LDVQEYLKRVSVEDYSNFCLGYAFTARDFNDGTLGLAWVAKPGLAGGVCEERQTIKNEKKSLNSGIVTLINYNSRVSDAVSQITFAHEVGHNFGSEHDQDQIKACTPGDSAGGNFIMYFIKVF
jgi:disintegrin and metalloproteinase domain-containing protein 10